MPTYFKNTLCISYGELVDRHAQPNVVGENAFLSQYDYLNYSKSKKLIIVRRACRNTEALYDFEKLPMTLKNQVAKRFKDVVKSAQQEPLKKLIQNDYKAYSFYSNYVLTNGEHLKENTIREYTATATVLNAIITLLNDGKAWRKALGGTSSKTGSIKNLIEVLSTMQATYGWKLPNSERGLRGKISDYKRLGYAGLISGKLCNDNAAKVAETEQLALLRRVMAQGRNLDDVQVSKLYNIAADIVGWKHISKDTVANKRDEFQIYADAGSRGKAHHENTHAMQHRRSAPTAPLYYWTVDGWDVELLYQKTEMDKSGSRRQTYHNRLTAVIVLDPCNKYPIGYAIGTHETPDLIKAAMRNAIKHTGELFGKMHHVHQLQTDRYGKGSLTPFYEAISNTYTPARAHNAKAKVIEPYFKHLNKNYCQLQHNWSGFGITSRKEVQPNGETLNKIRHSFPDMDGCIRQIENMIAGERAAKVESYLNAWNTLTNDRKLAWTHEEYLHHLGEVYGRTNRLEGQGIKKTIAGQSFFYDSFDANFRKHKNTDWILKCDPDDMSKVLAENEDSTLRYLLTEQYVQPMALIERKQGDSEQYHKINQFNKELVNDILEVQANDFKVLDELMQNQPVLQETLGKLLITDSNGQHKDNKSAARLAQKARAIEVKEVKREAKAIEQTTQSNQDDYIETILDFSQFIK